MGQDREKTETPDQALERIQREVAELRAEVDAHARKMARILRGDLTGETAFLSRSPEEIAEVLAHGRAM
ncbi:hypothetical protein ASG54_23065 [Aureimonas sp. Leaf460]|nr:hypothetical protein ASG62_24120 [Aureimonas sp. Leaf427]KQT62964.1 hypothetical protein ASG54_23065 [Aureimonas sp. Leaf460]